MIAWEVGRRANYLNPKGKTMNYYYMNEKERSESIVVYNTQPSEYQDLIDAYLAGGGTIKKIAAGAAEGALELGKFRAVPTTESEGGWGEFFKEAIAQ